MNKFLAVLTIALVAFGATACSSTSGDVAAARVRQQMNTNGGPN